MKYPNTETRQAFLKYLPKDIHEDDLVELEADSWALKGSSAPCEQHIKNYFGAYGPQWTRHGIERCLDAVFLRTSVRVNRKSRIFLHGMELREDQASARIS